MMPAAPGGSAEKRITAGGTAKNTPMFRGGEDSPLLGCSSRHGGRRNGSASRVENNNLQVKPGGRGMKPEAKRGRENKPKGKGTEREEVGESVSHRGKGRCL